MLHCCQSPRHARGEPRGPGLARRRRLWQRKSQAPTSTLPEQGPHSVATHRSISRPVGSATREHVGTASTVTNHREQRRFLAHFQQLSGPEHAHGSPRGLDGFFLHPADPSPALEKVASLHCLTARQLRRRRRKRQSGGGLARAFGKAPGALSARNCVPRPMTSTRVVLLRRRRARHEDDEASRY